jgi:hypothetical protein
LSSFPDPPEVIGLFHDLLPGDFRKRLEYPAPPPTLTGSEMEKGYLALTQYLLKVRRTEYVPRCSIV